MVIVETLVGTTVVPLVDGAGVEVPSAPVVGAIDDEGVLVLSAVMPTVVVVVVTSTQAIIPTVT